MAIINSSIFPFLTCFICILLAISKNQAELDQYPPEPFQYTLCSYEKGNFTNLSIYSTNLNSLLSTLPFDGGNAGGFYSRSYGENSGKVYATGLCRGDVKPDSCAACLSDATYLLKEACSNQKAATIWLEKCMLRYSNRSIYGVLQVLPSFYKWKSDNASWSDVDWSHQQLVLLLGRLTSEAAAGGDVRKFATGNASSPNTTSHRHTIYALVQCTPDLSEPECRSCLFSALEDDQFYGYRKEGGTVITPSCNLKYDVYPFFDSTVYEAASPLPVPPFFSSPPSTTTRKSRGKKSNRYGTAFIITVVSIVVSLVLILSAICTYRRGRKTEKIVDDDFSGLEMNLKEIRSPTEDFSGLKMNFKDIRSATDDFSDRNKLGEGGFGAVYKGILRSNGEEIAVKRLSMQSGQGDLEFKNEIWTLAKRQHHNLVKLRGFCVEKRERLLVYEFVPNGSLNTYIFDSTRRSELNWELRFKIIVGIGEGLLCLHEDSHHKIIHRDLKASNILLDANMDPKIADFGLARLFVVDQTQYNTERIVGTFGYMAPEYLYDHIISVKSDVYSFGVLILEIVRGEKISSAENFLRDAWENWTLKTSASLIDTTLGTDSTETIKMKRCIHIGLLCVQKNKEDRPTIGSVLSMLTNDSVPLPKPSQPAFVTSPVQPTKLAGFQVSRLHRSFGRRIRRLRALFYEEKPQTDLELASSLAVEC